MFYAINPQGETLIVGERPSWVRMQSNGVMALCPEDEGQGIVIGGEVFHVEGRPALEAPTVHLFWQEDTKAMVEAIKSGGGTTDHGEVLESAIRFVKSMFNRALSELPPDEILLSPGLVDEWTPGDFHFGDVRSRIGTIWKVTQPHNNLTRSEATRIPGTPEGADFWTPIRATLPELAQPFVTPIGEGDKYLKGSYVLVGGQVFRAAVDTMKSPEENPQAWNKMEV